MQPNFGGHSFRELVDIKDMLLLRVVDLSERDTLVIRLENNHHSHLLVEMIGLANNPMHDWGWSFKVQTEELKRILNVLSEDSSLTSKNIESFGSFVY